MILVVRNCCCCSVVPVLAMKADSLSRSIAPLILNIGPRLEWSSSCSCRCNMLEELTVPTEQENGWPLSLSERKRRQRFLALATNATLVYPSCSLVI